MPSPPINDSYDTGNSRWLSASSAQVCVDPLDGPGRNTNLVVATRRSLVHPNVLTLDLQKTDRGNRS